MNKRPIANRFGLIALISLSLLASTAFAGANPAPTQVVVTNTPAQPMPVVGLITDADNPARQYFETNLVSFTNTGSQFHKLVSVPATQKLVIEYVSGWCTAPVGFVGLRSITPSPFALNGELVLPPAFWSGAPAGSMPVRFYVKPGDDFGFFVGNSAFGSGSCYLAVSGYYVN